VRWLAVLHWVFWVNTWHDALYYKLLHGDKDTFALGFALAGHAAQYRQVRGDAPAAAAATPTSNLYIILVALALYAMHSMWKITPQ
jgi:hypothetical protein